ncbi:MAG: hypothetical protein ABIP13_03865, partial [Tepidiformaceae bacterium]
PAGAKSVAWSGVAGTAALAGLAAIITAAVIVGSTADRQTVQYSSLLQGRAAEPLAYDHAGGRVIVTLTRAYDPGDELVQILRAGRGEKVIVFEWAIRNVGGGPVTLPADVAELKYSDGETRRKGATFVGVGNGAAPRGISGHTTATVRAAFVVPVDATPLALDFQATFTGLGGITYDFR